MRESIQTAVQLMRSHPEYTHEDIFHQLLVLGLERSVVVQLVLLLPHAYGRVSLDGQGVLFSKEYICLDEAGNTCRKGWLDDLPLWREAMAFAREEVSKGVSVDDLLAVAGRSAEIDALNQALRDGKELKNLVCLGPAFLWTEFAATLNSGPVAETPMRWWQLGTWFNRSLPSNYSRMEKAIATGAFSAAILVGLFAIGIVGYYAISLWSAPK